MAKGHKRTAEVTEGLQGPMRMATVTGSVSDPYSLNPDPDPAKNLNPNPDPDPDPDPDPGKFFSPTKKFA